MLLLNREAIFGLFSLLSPSSSSGSNVATVVVGTLSSSLSVLLSVVVVVAAGVDKMPEIFLPPANLFLPELMPAGFRRLKSRFDFTRGPLRVTCEWWDLITFFGNHHLLFSHIKILFSSDFLQSSFSFSPV